MAGRRRTHRWLRVPALVVLLALAACPDDSPDQSGVPDDADDSSDTSVHDTESPPEHAPSSPDDQEPLEATNQDQTLRLTVDSVTRQDDLVVIEGTLTNTGDERFIPQGQLAELDYGGLERFRSNDLSGVVLIDWGNSTAHYPARTDAGQCACTMVEDYTEAALDPGASMDFFVAYELDDPSPELTLVAPGFQPVDGVPVQ